MEGFTLALGAAVVKSAAKLWLGDLPIAADASASAIDALVGRLNSVRDQRKLQRLFDQLEETVADRLTPLLDREFRSLDEGEREAAVCAVRETLEKAPLTDADLFAFDLDAGYLDRHLRAAVPGQAERSALSESGTAFYNRLLRECCGTLVEITKTLPKFQTGVLNELLRRDTETLELIREVLSRIPDRRSADDFEADYRQQVVALLDRMEFFGATLSGSARRYPLSVAYLSLDASAKNLQDARIEEVLALSKRRLLIRGEAGGGKTTLLQWLAVRCASRDTPASLWDWTDLLPFFIPLREYVGGELPAPEQFLKRVGRHIADEMPAGWVQQRLRDGRAIVLVDGVDELPAERRKAAREWLHELVTAFPRARYVVTSRPAAVETEWLDGDGFALVDLRPMTQRDVRAFVHRWHDAMRKQTAEEDELAELNMYEQELLKAISSRRALRRIAESPLLCALLCAFHRDRRGKIPDDRMTLYKTALEMLLGRRDEERGLKSLPGLFPTEQRLLLQDLAYWLVKNGESDAERSRVCERVAARLPSLARVRADPEEVLQYLLERTGLLREPVAGRVDFVHRTFQEYLAAKAAVEADEIRLLAAHAHLDQWREVIVLAAGHANRTEADYLLGALLRPHARSQGPSHLDLLAVACLETVSDLDPDLRVEIQHRAKALIPPRTPDAIQVLAGVGEFVLDVLAQRMEYSDEDGTIGAIEIAAKIGSEDAIPFLSRFAGDTRVRVIQALVQARENFESSDFAMQVLQDLPVQEIPIRAAADETANHLRHMQHLRRLEVLDRAGAGELSVLRGLDSLTHITVSNPRQVTIDLVDIALQPTLQHLAVEGPSRNWIVVARLPVLRSLELVWHAGTNDLAELAGLRQLQSLTLGGVAQVQNLSQLGFLEAPESLALVDWPDLCDVSYLSKWTASLSRVSLAGCPVTDLSPLRDLTRLRVLNLCGTGDRSDLDLMPLAGMTGLEIVVAADQEVRGAELLGPGSSVGVTG
jgi:hypothetical protein